VFYECIGFYTLSLGNPMDRAVIRNLRALSNDHTSTRQLHGLGDVSERGDWSCFRNVVHNGKSFVLTKDWFRQLPIAGKLDFDFVALPHFNDANYVVISDKRFVNLLSTMALVPVKAKAGTLASMQQPLKGRDGRDNIMEESGGGTGADAWQHEQLLRCQAMGRERHSLYEPGTGPAARRAVCEPHLSPASFVLTSQEYLVRKTMLFFLEDHVSHCAGILVSQLNVRVSCVHHICLFVSYLSCTLPISASALQKTRA
jgi:hypothetical protein